MGVRRTARPSTRGLAPVEVHAERAHLEDRAPGSRPGPGVAQRHPQAGQELLRRRTASAGSRRRRRRAPPPSPPPGRAPRRRSPGPTTTRERGGRARARRRRGAPGRGGSRRGARRRPRAGRRRPSRPPARGSPPRPARRAGTGASAARPPPPARGPWRRPRVSFTAFRRDRHPARRERWGRRRPRAGCSRKEAPPPARAVTRSGPAVHLGDGPGDGEAQPRPLSGRPPAPVEALEDALLVARARFPVHGRPPRGRAPPGPPPARTRTSVPGGVWRAAFSSRFTRSCSSRTGSTDTSSAAPGISVRTRWRESRSSVRERAAPTISSTGIHSRRAATAPGGEPGHVEQVPDQPLHPLRLVADGLHELAPGRLVDRLVAQRGRRPGDGGERRAQVVRDRGEQGAPQRLRLGPDRGVAGPVGERAHQEADAEHHGEGEEVAAVGDVQREGRRHEEVVVGEHAHGGRGDGRPASEVDGGDEDRDHVEHLDVRHVEHGPGGRADGGGPEHERHRPGVASQAGSTRRRSRLPEWRPSRCSRPPPGGGARWRRWTAPGPSGRRW